MFDVKICTSQAPNINKNIPKSGCKINSKETIKRQTIFIKIELSCFILYLPRNTALTITNDGFNNSDGWKEKFRTLIHLLAPFVSGKKKIAIKDKITAPKKMIKEIITRFFMERFDVRKIIKSPKRQNIKCFFKIISDGK